MLKLIGELAIAGLSFVAIKDTIDDVVKPEPKEGLTATQRAVFHTVQGGKAACLGAGAALFWPITAPIGAYKVGKAVVDNRHEIVEFVKDMPNSAKSTYRAAKAKAMRVVMRDKTPAPPSDFATEVAFALANGNHIGEAVEG